MKNRSKERRLFGTDGIRGVANVYPMTGEVAMKLGRTLVYVLRSRMKVEHPRIIVGKDTRLSGYMLETALTSGITSMGGHALLLGPIPTPGVSYLIRSMRAHGGVMISASHNPYQDNGLKVFGMDGFKLDDSLEADLEHLMIHDDEVTALRPRTEELGRARRLDDALGRYLTNLKTLFRQDFDLNGKKIVFDAANGAAYDCGVKLFEELGAEVTALACKPNGMNINAQCAQENLQEMSETIRRTKSDMGIAVDGDADRLLVIDEFGNSVSGEHILFGMACFMRDSDRLKGHSIVTTMMANQALEMALQKEGISVVRTQVGDRYVVEAMKKNGWVLGGETSGHYIFLDQNTTADGLFSALEILALLHRKKTKASDLHKSFKLLPQKLVSVKVKDRIPLENVPEVHEAIQKLEKKYDKQGRVYIRYSGTEISLRVMLEGPEASAIEQDVNELTTLIQRALG